MSNLLSQASLVMIPSGYKEDIVYSQIPTSGAGDLSFTRASNGTRINSAGLVEVCPWNLLSNSEEFTSANGWIASIIGGSTASQTSNYGVAPNGTTTADRIQLALNGQAYADWVYVSSPSVIVGQTYTYSVYIKSLSGTKTIKFFSDGSSNIIKNITTEWVRYDYTWTATSAPIYPRFLLEGGTSTSADLLAWGFQLNIGSTAKPYFPTTDRLNVPRLTYQNGGGGCPSLLLEKQSTNLALYSQDISNTSGSYWGDGSSGGTAVATANYATSPDGTQNATRLQLNEGSLYAVWQQVISTTSGTTYTYSIWLKAVSGTPTILFLYDGTGNRNVTLTNEWVRYTFTFTGGTLAIARFGLWSSVWGTSSTADILTWGAQLEASSYPTSLIPTTSASATRVADLSTSDTIQTAQTFAGDFTIFADFVPFIDSTDANGLMILGGGASGLGTTYRSYLWFVGSNVYLSGDGEVNIIQRGYSMVVNQRVKIALTRVGTTVKMFVNGAQVGASATSSTSITIRSIGWSYNLPTYQTKGKINQVVLSATGFSDADCQSLTTI